jgi:alkylation response protein AidB-like acyl-CoA dehydrogenase
MTKLPQYRVAGELEAFLGDPMDPENAWSFKTSMEWDEREEFPQPAIDKLRAFGINDHYIPVAYGGKLHSYEEFLSLGRLVARRDMTAAITYSTFVWSTLAWIGGSEEQKIRQANYIKNNSEAFCLAYSEEDHGSDLLSNELRAVKTQDGYVLTGEKWPINRATRSGAAVLLAKTSGSKDSRSLSVFMLYKSDLDPSHYSHLSRVKTLGLRGCEISGLRFNDCPAPAEARVGEEGHGLDLALKAFQVTRTLCAGLSLGATDTALRVALDFALQRKLYSKTVFDIPHARGILVNAFADMLICESMAIASARGLHVATEQFSTWSAVIKYFVPTTLEHTVQQLSVVLGARFYLREKHHHGIFQKMLRDNGVVSLFDGSTVVNLKALTLQLPYLARNLAKSGEDRDNLKLRARLTGIFALNQALPQFNGKRLDLFGRGQDDVLQGVEVAMAKLHAMPGSALHEQTVPGQVLALAEILQTELRAFCAQVELSAGQNRDTLSAENFELSQHYCLLHAAATCLQFWIYNQGELDQFFNQGEWLVFCLTRILRQLQPSIQKCPASYETVMANQLVRLFDENRLFSFIPMLLAQQAQEAIPQSMQQ